MPAYNAARYIGNALASLLRQRDAASLDIVVLDDGSTDATAAIVRSLGAAEIRLIETENCGVTAARNTLLAAIAPDTDFVSFLDSDDLSPAGRFAADLARFDARPELAVRYGTMRLFSQTGDDPLAPDPRSTVIDTRGIHLGAGIYRRTTLSAVGAFDLAFKQAEDTDFLLRLFEAGPALEITDDIVMYYRRHDTNMTRDTALVRREFARALMKSAHRRRGGTTAPIPPGLFDASNFNQRVG
ncbi:MAG: glycosyl transferase [Devosia sp.]|nr:glycosyl transferase [Devosia sp.]